VHGVVGGCPIIAFSFTEPLVAAGGKVNPVVLAAALVPCPGDAYGPVTG
jgi:hypothetical protein